MEISLTCGDNALTLSSLQYLSEEMGSRLNTTLRMTVRSFGFCGDAAWIGELSALEGFLRDLRELYAYARTVATLTDNEKDNRITITMEPTGEIAVEGILSDTHHQSLIFSFHADQTVLLPFITSLSTFLTSP